MSRLLVHIATGPENPTRAALGLLVARTALAGGHDVDLFFAGDGVGILRPETLDAGQGIGTGSFREHLDALVAGGATLTASGMSSKARGLGPDGLGGLPVTMAPPDGSSSSRSWRTASWCTERAGSSRGLASARRGTVGARLGRSRRR